MVNIDNNRNLAMGRVLLATSTPHARPRTARRAHRRDAAPGRGPQPGRHRRHRTPAGSADARPDEGPDCRHLRQLRRPAPEEGHPDPDRAGPVGHRRSGAFPGDPRLPWTDDRPQPGHVGQCATAGELSLRRGRRPRRLHQTGEDGTRVLHAGPSFRARHAGRRNGRRLRRPREGALEKRARYDRRIPRAGDGRDHERGRPSASASACSRPRCCWRIVADDRFEPCP